MRHFGGFPRQLRHRVPDLSAYATKMRVPLVLADMRNAPPSLKQRMKIRIPTIIAGTRG
jgi:hypothetical protein